MRSISECDFLVSQCSSHGKNNFTEISKNWKKTILFRPSK